MKEDLLNILSNSNKDIDNQKIMDYLQGTLPPAESNTVEQWLAEDMLFTDDALEGIAALSEKEKVGQKIALINARLLQALRKKKLKRRKHLFMERPWNIIAIALLLSLALAAFWIISKLLLPH